MARGEKEEDKVPIDRSKRVAFEEVADLYQEVRPGYPEELVEDILSLSGIASDGRILEIGCGPGNATVAFARRGYRVAFQTRRMTRIQNMPRIIPPNPMIIRANTHRGIRCIW